MRLPEGVIPLMQALAGKMHLSPEAPLEIWKQTDHRIWIDGFTELATALYVSDLDEKELPVGYGWVAHLFDWEAQCQFDGWVAFGNRRDTIADVIAAYRHVGLVGEADALTQAHAAWMASEGNVAATTAAYDTVRHDYSIDLDRLEYLVCYFVDHADRLFYMEDGTEPNNR